MTVLDKLKKAKVNCVNHFVEKQYEVNVRFVDEATEMQIILAPQFQQQLANIQRNI